MTHEQICEMWTRLVSKRLRELLFCSDDLTNQQVASE